MHSLVNRLTNGYGSLEKSKGLTLETAIDIGRMFEATKDEMQVIAGEDPRVEINTLVGKNMAPRKRRKAKQSESKGKPQAQKCNMRCGYNSHKQKVHGKECFLQTVQ